MEDHGVPEAGKLPRVWTRSCRETMSRQRACCTKNSWLDSAELDEKSPESDDRGRNMTNSPFYQF